MIARLGLAAFGVAGLVTACIAPGAGVQQRARTVDGSRACAATGAIRPRRCAAPVRDGDHGRGRSGRPDHHFFWVAGARWRVLAFIWQVQRPTILDWPSHLASTGWLCQCVSAVFVSLFTARQDYRRIASIGIGSTVTSTLSMLLFIPAAPYASTFLGCQALGFADRPADGPGLVPRHGAMAGAAGAASRGARQAGSAGAAGKLPHRVVHCLRGRPIDICLARCCNRNSSVSMAWRSASRRRPISASSRSARSCFRSSARCKESEDRKVDLLFRSSWILNVLAASALGALIPVAGPLLHVWTGAEVAAEAARVLVVMSIAGILGSSANVFGFYLLAQGRSRSNALIALITGVVTLVTSAIVLPSFGWQAAGWSACAGMIAQMATIVMLLRRSFDLPGMWPRVIHCVLMPLGIGIATALALRYGLDRAPFQLAPSWWSVGVSRVADGCDHLRRRGCRVAAGAVSKRLLAGLAGHCQSLRAPEGHLGHVRNRRNRRICAAMRSSRPTSRD